MNPSPVLSGTLTPCMERDLDVSQYGCRYNTSGIMCAGLGTVVDSLAAVDYLVFRNHKVTFAQLRDILQRDWEGAELLRQEVRQRAPKWGCGDAEVDALGSLIAGRASEIIENTPNVKGGTYQIGLWSIDYCLFYGEKTGATPDGRHRGEMLSKNSGSTVGCEREGIAGLLESVAKLDHAGFADGSVLDVMLPKSTVAGPEGPGLIVSIIRAFFAAGGENIHFNILSADELRAARREPEKHRDLQVRLCGWNVRFVDLPVKFQDSMIAEAESRGA